MSRFIGAGRLLAFPGQTFLRQSGGIRAGRVPAAAALGAAALAVLLAGCAGGGQASVALPPKAAAQSPARLADQPGVRQQVIAAYAGYWQASDEALNAGNAARARQILARYAPATALPGLIKALGQDWARHAVTDGSPALHIVSVRIRDGRATVHDCVDLSHAGLQHARTGRIFPHSFGSPRANYYASLVRQGGRWLVSNIVPVVTSCEP
jgi:hypothetical protein